MATLTTATLTPLNDQKITLTGLSLSGVPTSGATVTATLLDESGVVVSALENVTLQDVNGTPGDYSAFIVGTFTAQPGDYVLKITAEKDGSLYFTEQPIMVPYYRSVYLAPGSLTTVAALKRYLGETKDANADLDLLYAKVIERFTAYALNQTNRKSFLEQSYTEKSSGTGNFQLSPKYAFATSPITGVTSLTVNGNAIPAAESDTASGYVFDNYTVYLRGYYYTKGIMNVGITYTAGLDSIPKELEQAALDACAFWLKRREFIGKESVNVQGETVVFDKSDIPATALAVLKQFTRRK